MTFNWPSGIRTIKFCHRLVRRQTIVPRCVVWSVRSSSTTSPKEEENVKPFDSIPGPTRLPIFGTSWKFILEGLAPEAKPLGKRILDNQAESVDQYGKILRVRFPGMDMVVVADPEDMGRVIRAEAKYPKRLDFPVIDYYREKRKKTPGVFFANDEEWYKHRSVISKRILRPKEITEYVPTFNEIITDFISRLRGIRDPVGKERENEILQLDNELFRWSFESIADVLFDKRFGCLEQEINEEVQEFIDAIGLFLNSVLSLSLLPVAFYKIYETRQYKYFVNAFDKIYKFAELNVVWKINELREKESQAKGSEGNGRTGGFFEFLLCSGKLTEEDLLASVIDLIFAGVDTTSNTMQWALYLLAKNPDKQEKLHQEVASVLQQNQPDPHSLAQMPYLKACIRETLRLYPVLSSLSRNVDEDMVIRGYQIPANTKVVFPVYYMGRSEELFQDAHSFKPERWLCDKKNAALEVKSAFASIPFGFGTRMCIGRRIAELEMYVLLTRLVQEFHIKYPIGEEVEPFMRGVTVPDRAMRVKFEDRKT